MILPRSQHRRWLAQTVATVLLLPSLPAFGQATAPESSTQSAPTRPADTSALSPVHVLHLTLTGDLDTTRLAPLIREHVDRAIARQPSRLAAVPRSDAPLTLIVLELSGDRWRADALAALAALLADDSLAARTALWLRDPADQRVGGGHAALALIVADAFIDPRTHVHLDPDDELVPPARALSNHPASSTDDHPDPDLTSDQAHDLESLLISAVQSRRADPLLTVLLPRPTQPLWYIQTEEGAALVDGPSRPTTRAWKLLSEPPTATGGQSAPPHARVPSRLSPSDLLSLGVVRGQARTLPQLLGALACRQQSIERATLTSPLPAARDRIHRHAAAVAQTLRDLDASLYKLERSYGTEWDQRKRRAGRDGLDTLAAATRTIDDLRRTLDDNPELLDESTVPPSTATGPAPRESNWTALLDRLRDEHAALDRRARRLAE